MDVEHYNGSDCQQYEVDTGRCVSVSYRHDFPLSILLCTGFFRETLSSPQLPGLSIFLKDPNELLLL